MPAEAIGRDERLRRAVDEHYLFVWRSLRRLGIPKGEADDVAQEVFLVFSRKLDGVEVGAERPFLFRCAANFAMHARRAILRRRTLQEKAAIMESDSAHPSVEDDAERQEEIALVDTLLAELPDELRDIVVLCELEEMTLAEASVVLGIPPGTAASRLRRARAELSAGMTRLQRSTK
ncbi:RNA polymerase sigma factor [Labilithrix luteola]|nr:sigma-70 family RNA polymerase sigma factor [Labilithrix luteola]